MRMTTAVLLLSPPLASLVAGCTSLPAPQVPDKLRVPAGQSVSLEARASGVQVYTCEATKTDPTRVSWVFKEPQAALYDRNGKPIGKHYAGPTWESTDGSKVVGALVAQDPGPDATAIPWLLLTAKSTAGGGVLSATKSIQRVNTVGGRAPAEGCDPTLVGNVARVPYQATYYFFVAGRGEQDATSAAHY
ncbi:conserved exported hypothetical protein [Burkholderiales bacterium]|nr:conserved exported hypothetical protein [Burkholderiales bacterium]